MKPAKPSFLIRAKRFLWGVSLGAALGIPGMRGSQVGMEYLRGRPAAQAGIPISSQRARLEQQREGRGGRALEGKQAPPKKVLPEFRPAFPAASGRMSVLLRRDEPCLSVAQIDAELRRHGSPAVGAGWAFVKWGRQYAIRPAVALAFFRMESSWGKRGLARQTRAIGNIRYTRKSGSGVQYSNHKGFRSYASWEDGIRDFFALLSSSRYAGGSRTTLEEIIPRYAPHTENDLGRYQGVVVGYLNELFKNAQHH